MRRITLIAAGVMTLTVISLLLFFLAAGTSARARKPGADAVVCGGGHPAQNVQLHGTRRSPVGTVTLYSAACPSLFKKGEMQQGFGFSIRSRRRFVGHDVMRSWTDRLQLMHEVQPPGRPLVEWDHAPGSDSTGSSYTIVYGKVLAPEVVAMEATFGNGRGVLDTPEASGFAIVLPDATDVCSLTALGEERQILGRINMEGGMCKSLR